MRCQDNFKIVLHSLKPRNGNDYNIDRCHRVLQWKHFHWQTREVWLNTIALYPLRIWSPQQGRQGPRERSYMCLEVLHYWHATQARFIAPRDDRLGSPKAQLVESSVPAWPNIRYFLLIAKNRSIWYELSSATWVWRVTYVLKQLYRQCYEQKIHL